MHFGQMGELSSWPAVSTRVEFVGLGVYYYDGVAVDVERLPGRPMVTVARQGFGE
jgi:hypothetical protein